MTKQKKPRIRMPKWLAKTFLVLGILFLLGATTGQLDMFIIGSVLTVLAVLALRGDNPITIPKFSIKQSVNQPSTNLPKPKRSPLTILRDALLVIVLLPIALVIIAIAIAVGNSSTDNNNSDDSPATQQTTEQKQAEQKQLEQKIAAEYQEVVDTFAPIYCTNHQDITVNEPTLHKDGWPMTDNTKGITKGECEILIGLLYIQRPADSHEKKRAIIQSIAESKVAVGMTKVEVVYSWGSPGDINTTVVAGNRSEQWVYGSPIYGGNYVYFDNGIVTGLQN